MFSRRCGMEIGFDLNSANHCLLPSSTSTKSIGLPYSRWNKEKGTDITLAQGTPIYITDAALSSYLWSGEEDIES